MLKLVSQSFSSFHCIGPLDAAVTFVFLLVIRPSALLCGTNQNVQYRSLKVKGKVKHHAMKTYGEWRYGSTILDLGTRWRSVVSFTPLPLYFFHWLYSPLGPWPQLLETVGLLGRVISSSQGLYLNTHWINTYTHQTYMPCVGFAPTIPAFRATEDSSCLRPLG
jgi:hypothetical protein